MKCDESCPCPLGEACLGRRFPEVFGAVFRAHWESGDPVLRQHVINRSAIGYTPPDPELSKAGAPPPEPPRSTIPAAVPGSATVDEPTPAPSYGFPLAGDIIAAATARLGIDRLAKYMAEQLGVECGCPERQQKLNRLDMRLRKWLGMG
jgi:hypothetical protein